MPPHSAEPGERRRGVEAQAAPAPAPAQPPPAARSLGIDVARGLAVVLMIQTHAYDGWVAPAHKASFGYRLSRVFASVPAPLFLLLAGVGLALGAAAMQRRGAADPSVVRRALLGRALRIVGYGYALSGAYALIEGRFDAATLLRADILHAIGLSLSACTLLLVGVPPQRLVARVGLLVAGALALGVLVPRVLPPLPAVLRPLAALLVDVAPYTRFPLLPLCGFTAVGYFVGACALPGRPRRALLLSLGLIASVPLWQLLTAETLRLLGGALSRRHPAVVWNFCEGTARALAALYGAAALTALAARASVDTDTATDTDRAPRGLGWLVRLGRGSLLAYALHVPLCYGRLAAPFAGKLEMATATPLVTGLIGLVWLCLWLRDRAQKARRRGARSVATR
ncbi:MAG: heparan-alpha-glucosaminide N-acetyltransferase domain-containing protein [Polyangia bacterium]